MSCVTNVVADISVYSEGCNVAEWFRTANVTDNKACSGVVIIKKNSSQIAIVFRSGKVT